MLVKRQRTHLKLGDDGLLPPFVKLRVRVKLPACVVKAVRELVPHHSPNAAKVARCRVQRAEERRLRRKKEK